MTIPSGCPMAHKNESPSSEGCPMASISPENMMPTTISQQPTPGQTHMLPTDRQISSIPRSDGAQKWIYPSEQQFYNALARKGHETDERDVRSIVHIHNEINERCWREIRKVEKFIAGYVNYI
jgi:cytochrome c heme-lyase